MNRELSEKLDLLRFPLIVCVVFIHSQIGTVRFSDTLSANQAGFAASIIQATFSEILRGFAVPMFFLLSGYLFFTTFEPTAASYFSKVRTRCRTLAVPFLFWNTLVLLFLFLASQVPVLSPFFTGGSWALPEGGLFGVSNALIGINRMPILYPFWFLRDLIVLVLVSPVIWYLAARLPWAGLAICSLSWMYQTPTAFPVLHHHAPLLFFYLGGLMAVRTIDPLGISHLGRIPVLLFFVVVLVSVLLKMTEAPPNARLWFEKISAFVSILAFWSVIVLLNRKTVRVLASLSGLSFFVYATHEPTLIILTKLFFRFYPPSGDVQLLSYYFAIPAGTVVVTAILGMVLQSQLKGFYRTITGGRDEKIALATRYSHVAG